MANKANRKLRHHNKNRPSANLERLVMIVAIAEPLMTVPQILQIYVSHNTGVSLATWTLYLIASLVWLVYGVKTRNKPIIITDILWIIMEAAVIVGVLHW